MKRKLKPAGSRSVSEVIIATQSFFLFAFGMAGIMATSTVVAGFAALRNRDSAFAIVTDEGIQTEHGVVSVERVSGIINNFELVGVCVSVFGLVVLIATCIRIYNKSKPEPKVLRKRKS